MKRMPHTKHWVCPSGGHKLTKYDAKKHAFWCPVCKVWIKWAAVIGRDHTAQENLEDYLKEYDNGGVDLAT